MDYQAVYDAVRSKIGYCDIGEAVREAMSSALPSYSFEQVAEEFKQTAYQQARPSFILKPKLTIDGNMWCALYGDNLQDGVTGFGKSPEEAYADFDKNWCEPLQEGK